MPPPERRAGPSYRDDLATAYARIAELEARSRDLEMALVRRSDTATTEHLRDLNATLERWDRIRARLALLLGLTGLFALRIAERWSVRTALLASCSAMVLVGITLAWPKIVRARVDPKPYAKHVSRRGRRRRTPHAPERPTLTVDSPGVRVDLPGVVPARPRPGDGPTDHAEVAPEPLGADEPSPVRQAPLVSSAGRARN